RHRTLRLGGQGRRDRSADPRLSRSPGSAALTGERWTGEPDGQIVTAAAQERRLLEPRQIVGQPRDERISGAAAEAGLCAGARAGEVEGGRDARHVDVARWSDREGDRLVVAAAAERGRLEQRVD